MIDHSRVNPELGGEDGLRALADACQSAGLGLIVDIVPNHMAVWEADNPAWLDVLERGAASRSARLFDIDFDSPDPGLFGKVLAPILGEPYGEALSDGKIELIVDAGLGKLTIAYGPHRLPIRPEDYAALLDGCTADTADLTGWNDPGVLHGLLERQHFRLAWWRSAGDAINWRRFFDVNELAGLRIEDDVVFETVHATLLRLYGEGVIDGVRVDHIDGLADPAAYAHTLRRRLTALNESRPQGAPRDGPYIVVEKILGAGEALPTDWAIDGTSGYDFMNEVDALQHAAEGEADLDTLWDDISDRTTVFDQEEILARLEILHGGFAGQLAVCAQAFEALARQDLASRDLSAEAFRRILAALISRLRIYRSYATGRVDAPTPAPEFADALDDARSDLPADAPAFAFLERVLHGQGPGGADERAAAVRRLNQLTAPVAAKAVEDTAFYRYGRLLSRNDVGFDAARLALNPETFLASGETRAQTWPHAMLTTATHDHKRGEDVRARLAVLSEIPTAWRDRVLDWWAITSDQRPDAIAAEDGYSLFQTLVGVWPLGLAADDAPGLAALSERVSGWRVKSLREAKLRSSWAAPNLAYEDAATLWQNTLLDPARSPAFLASLTAFVAKIAPAGAVNGVVQAALRCTWPGVPDLYQGAELWDLSLVDPDNRRPVDFDLRAKLLGAGSHDWCSGAVKQAMIARLLNARRTDPGLFTTGEFRPLEIRGARSNHVLAFQRRTPRRTATIAVTLHLGAANLPLGSMPTADWWADTKVSCTDGDRRAEEIFSALPVFFELAPEP